MRNFCGMLLVIVGFQVHLHAQEATNLAVNCQVRLASPAEARKLLTTDDDYLQTLSRFDLQVRLQRIDGATLPRLKERITQEVLAWNQEDGAKVLSVMDRLRERTAGWKIPWPRTVLMIQTTGREDADAPYTRANAIVLPKKSLRNSIEKMEQLFVHELFHILSRANPEFRQKMYAVIGFEVCPEIPLPAAIRERKITNPDAPRIDAVQRISQGMERFAITPVLISKTEHYDPVMGGTLFKYADFRLMRLQQTAEGWKPQLMNDQAILLEPSATPEFHQQIGANTGYIIHPDEVLADNFIHLIFGTGNLKSPQVIEGMKKVLQTLAGNNPLRME